MRGGKRLNRDALSLRGLYEWVQVLVCAVTATVLLFTFAARVVLVSGPSMRETLQHRDCLLVVNAHLCGGFEAGDIVIIRKESFKDGEPIVKRVIATEGQTVDIDFTAGAVYVDGQLLGRTTSASPPIWRRGWSSLSPCRRAASLLWATTATTAMTAGIQSWGRWIPGRFWDGRCSCCSQA